MIIKICGITSEEDAQAAIESGANAIGLNFYRRSPRFVEPDRARLIARSLPANCLKVGVFVNATSREIGEMVESVGLDVVQLHGAPCETQWRTWHAVTLGSPTDVQPRCEAYLLDAPSQTFGGSGKTIDWELAASFPHRKIVAGGLDASNVAAAIRAAEPWGVDACSRLESSPGRKNPQRVRDFVDAALAAFGRVPSLTEQELSI